MISNSLSSPLDETSKIKDLLMHHPEALRVLLDCGVPVSCADGTVADAARACGMKPQTLLAQLKSVVGAGGAGSSARMERYRE